MGPAPNGSASFGADGPPVAPLLIRWASLAFAGCLSTALERTRVGHNPGQFSRGLPNPVAAPCVRCSQLFRAKPERAEEAAEEAAA